MSTPTAGKTFLALSTFYSPGGCSHLGVWSHHDEVQSLPSQVITQIRAADAGAAELKGNRGPPSALVRVASAFLYIVPWIDVLSLGREVYHFFPTSLLLYLIPGKHSDASSILPTLLAGCSPVPWPSYGNIGSFLAALINGEHCESECIKSLGCPNRHQRVHHGSMCDSRHILQVLWRRYITVASLCPSSSSSSSSWPL